MFYDFAYNNVMWNTRPERASRLLWSGAVFNCNNLYGLLKMKLKVYLGLQAKRNPISWYRCSIQNCLKSESMTSAKFYNK